MLSRLLVIPSLVIACLIASGGVDAGATPGESPSIVILDVGASADPGLLSLKLDSQTSLDERGLVTATTTCAGDVCLALALPGSNSPTGQTTPAPMPQRMVAEPSVKHPTPLEAVPEAVWWMIPALALTGLMGKILAVGPGRWTALLARPLRWLLIVPLFSRIAQDRLLDNRVRSDVADFVTQNPGATIQEVRVALDVAWGTAVYHLDRLERGGHLVSARAGNHHRFWVSGSPEARLRHALVLLHQPTMQRIARLVCNRPGVHQAALCQELGLRNPNASKHLRRLQDHDLVDGERVNRRVVYNPTPTLQNAMKWVGGEVTASEPGRGKAVDKP